MSQTCSDSLHGSMFKLILHVKTKAWVYRQLLAVILSAMALAIVPKVEFNFEVILFITISVFLSPGSCFKSAIRYQNSISKHTDSYVIQGCWRKEKFFNRKAWEDSALACTAGIFWTRECTFSYLGRHLGFDNCGGLGRGNISRGSRR